MPALPALTTEIDFGDVIAPVEVRINRRAKRLIVRVDSMTGIVLVTAPSKRSIPAALSFARERALWIKSELAHGPQPRPFRAGGVCPYLGEAHLIERKGGPRSRVKRVTSLDEAHPADAKTRESAGNEPLSQPLSVSMPASMPAFMPRVIVGGDEEHLNRRLTDWLRREARAQLTAMSDQYCEALAVKRRAIRITDTRSRWGSCSEDGTISYNWRLILAPKDILDYVAAHECAHLVHMNHSPAFWQVVASLGVDAKNARQWFRDHGHDLFTYGVSV